MVGHANHPTVTTVYGELLALIEERKLRTVTLADVWATPAQRLRGAVANGQAVTGVVRPAELRPGASSERVGAAADGGAAWTGPVPRRDALAAVTGGFGPAHAGHSAGGAELPPMTAPDEEIR